MTYDPQLHCRVCGLKKEEPPWGDDGKSPDFCFCECCGTETGYQDCQLSAVRNQRRRWLKDGAWWNHPDREHKPAGWYYPEHKPKDWDLETQLQQIPPEFRD